MALWRLEGYIEQMIQPRPSLEDKGCVTNVEHDLPFTSPLSARDAPFPSLLTNDGSILEHRVVKSSIKLKRSWHNPAVQL